MYDEVRQFTLFLRTGSWIVTPTSYGQSKDKLRTKGVDIYLYKTYKWSRSVSKVKNITQNPVLF